MMRNVAIALGLIAALTAAMLLLVSRATDQGGTQSAGAPAGALRASNPTAAPPQGGDVAERSRALMPPGYETIALGMPLADVRRARPRVQPEPTGAPHPDGYQVWYEDDVGADQRVLYLFDPNEHRLAQVQFAAQLPRPGALGDHLRAIDRRFGTPTGVWDCPQSESASPVRRFTWRREGASAMDAILLHGERVAATFIVAPTERVGESLRRARCRAVTSPDEIARLPVANELRGPQAPTLREVGGADR